MEQIVMEKRTGKLLYLAIRADANPTIASGHLMRCIAIATACQKKNIPVLFIVSEPDGMELLQSRGFHAICLYNSYREKENELEMLLKICQEQKVTHILVDSYEVTIHYLQRLREEMVLFYLDDLNLFYYPVDVLINYSLGIRMRKYASKGDYQNTEILLGSSYTPLRQEFSGSPINVQKECENLLITTGGSDPYQVSYSLAKALRRNASTVDMRLHIIVGKFYGNIEEMQQLVAQDKKMFLYQNISNMAEVMRKCDLAVSAGGTTLSELCACGVPTVAFTMADNQIVGTKAYADADILYYVGDARKDGLIEKLTDQICTLKEDEEKRIRMSHRSRQCVDGKGAERIAEAIASYDKIK